MEAHRLVVPGQPRGCRAQPGRGNAVDDAVMTTYGARRGPEIPGGGAVCEVYGCQELCCTPEIITQNHTECKL